MYKVIVFDLDDTLYFEKDYVKSGYKIISKYLNQKYGLNEKVIYKEMLFLFYKSPKNIFNRILDKYNISYSNEDIQNMITLYRNHKPKIKLSKDVRETLIFLLKKDYRLGIITDGFKEAQRKKIQVLHLEKYFEKIIVTDELGENREYWKPHEKSYILMKEYFNVEFNEMIYIGDNISKDFIAPIKLGILPIQIINKKNVYQEKSAKITKVKSINEILKLKKI
ncbi:MAG: HAD family hydrolase [Fusobacterium sp.]